MATYYATEFVGGPDGTQLPPRKLDGRVIGAKKRRVRASKPNTAIAVADKLYIGKLPQGASLRGVAGVTDTSFGTTTLSVGTLAVPNKYVDAKILTATDLPTALGPKASAFVADPITADEDIYVTFGVAGIAAPVVAAFDMEYTISA